MLFDAVVALDILASRPEVDRERLAAVHSSCRYWSLRPPHGAAVVLCRGGEGPKDTLPYWTWQANSIRGILTTT